MKKKQKLDVLICPKCNFENDDDAKFCEHCGTKINIGEKEQSKQQTLFKRIWTYKRYIFLTFLLLCGISFFLFFMMHKWRWEDFYGEMNKYNMGGYIVNTQHTYGIYRYHWYGYEAWMNGVTMREIQVTDYYIACQIQSEDGWSFFTPDGKFGYTFDNVSQRYEEILPLISCNTCKCKSYSEELCRLTNLLWVKDNGYWGAANLQKRIIQIPFNYEDVNPVFKFEKDQAYIICKKDGLWGSISITYLDNTITESIPFVYEDSIAVEHKLNN